MATDVNIPSAWANDDSNEMLNGLDITHKSELVGVPIRIVNVMFRTNAQGIQIAEIDAEKATGEMVVFTDSSTGVREQLHDYFTGKGIQITDGEVHETRIVCPRGLRVSKYQVEVRGKMRDAETYYLSTSGRRAVSTPVQP